MPLLTHTGVLSPEIRSASELRRAPWFVLGANGFDGGRDAGGGAQSLASKRVRKTTFSQVSELLFLPL